MHLLHQEGYIMFFALMFVPTSIYKYIVDAGLYGAYFNAQLTSLWKKLSFANLH